MRIIGFTLNKISGYRSKEFKSKHTDINIDFLEIIKEELDLIKDRAIKVSFAFKVSYQGEKEGKKAGEIVYEGEIVINTTEEEAEDIINSWKNKDLSPDFRVPLFNFILQKCSIRALNLEEDLQLPTHIPLPVLRQENPEEKKK